MAEQTGSVGTYNLNGGLLSLSGAGLSSGAGNATFNFSGGTLMAGSSIETSVPIVLATSGSNGVFDPGGTSIVLDGSLSGPGGLIETDSGTLTLNGTNTYTGGTTVLSGTLVLNGAASLLDGSSLTIGSTASTNGGNIYLPNSQPNPAALTPVPEPSTALMLICAVITSLLWSGAQSRRVREARACRFGRFAVHAGNSLPVVRNAPRVRPVPGFGALCEPVLENGGR
jgi:autotransporter-associated beta strand protein